MYLLHLPISKVTIVRALRDMVHFEIQPDLSYPGYAHMRELHAGFDEFNGRDIKIETVAGNGPNLARLLGWPGEIEVIDVEQGSRGFFHAWDFECKSLHSKPEKK